MSNREVEKNPNKKETFIQKGANSEINNEEKWLGKCDIYICIEDKSLSKKQ